MNNQNYSCLFVKIDRISAWILLGSIVLYFISGYGMTEGIIDRERATVLHLNTLPLVALSAFFIHTFFAIRLAFIRWKIWNRVSMIGLFLLYVLSFFAFLYFELFFVSKFSDINTTMPQKSTEASGLIDTKTEVKNFSFSELAKYDGKNGNLAYVAVDGSIYDVSNIFENGVHFGHAAGQELSDAFYTKHVKAQITKYPIVGKLE
jgi:predicted heme/steroid binding protein